MSAHWKGDDITYKHMHKRLRVARGRASEHQCEECGKPAMDWAYKDPSGWSTNLDDYRPLCRTCHMQVDGRAEALRVALSAAR